MRDRYGGAMASLKSYCAMKTGDGVRGVDDEVIQLGVEATGTDGFGPDG